MTRGLDWGKGQKGFRKGVVKDLGYRMVVVLSDGYRSQRKGLQGEKEIDFRHRGDSYKVVTLDRERIPSTKEKREGVVTFPCL